MGGPPYSRRTRVEPEVQLCSYRTRSLNQEPFFIQAPQDLLSLSIILTSLELGALPHPSFQYFQAPRFP